ncbi:MAG: flagellar biosynthesis repressor FlbT [Alphaproteobacteria bacterium]|nr:flagellar biosynthesis repressor FlbT [Alphaproteobacteria bacterium]
MALKISLKPGERFVINGAIVQNGDRRTNLVLHNKVAILREKDILLPENATTPVRRIYFAVMMMYLDPTTERDYHQEFVRRMAEFINAIRTDDVLQTCVTIIDDVYGRNFYNALVNCKKLLVFEQDRLDLAANMSKAMQAASAMRDEEGGDDGG